MYEQYDHYIAVDWAQTNMAIARMTKSSKKMHLTEVPASVNELKVYLKSLKGRKILTIEESSTSQWLYIELKDHVDELIICDPYRNFLLSEGTKSDKIDAIKLVHLLRSGLLKPVFHSTDDLIYLRKIVSAYDDLVKMGVRLKNQRAALFISSGLDRTKDSLTRAEDKFVVDGLDQSIQVYEDEKKRFEKEFDQQLRKHKSLRDLKSLPGIGPLHALKIAAMVVEAKRFPTAGHFLSYCGLIKLDRSTGGKSFAKKQPRCCRLLKNVFKTAALSATADHVNNPMRDLYLFLQNEKRYPEFKARHAVARRIAILAYGILKTGEKYQPERRSIQARAA